MPCVFPLHFSYDHEGWIPGQIVRNVVILRENVFSSLQDPPTEGESRKSKGRKPKGKVLFDEFPRSEVQSQKTEREMRPRVEFRIPEVCSGRQKVKCGRWNVGK